MEKEKVIALFGQLAAIGFIFIIMIVTLVLYVRAKRNRDLKHKQEMEKDFAEQMLLSQIEVQEQTFLEIGRDLHDNVCQLLSTARMLMGLTERNLTDPPDTLLTANHTVAQAIQEIRDLSRTLDKEWLEQFSFFDNLKNVIQRINSAKIINIDCDLGGKLNYTAAEQIIIFRIVQEAIQNSIRHAAPTSLNIKTFEENNLYSIVIADDGKGVSIDRAESGLGLKNMRRRTELLGGEIAWSSQAPNGTVVKIMLPLNR